VSALARSLDNHIHLPSVHIRKTNGSGLDYEENFYINGRGRRRRIERVIRLVILEHGEPALIRETFDTLCAEEWTHVENTLPILMDEGNPDANSMMEERARNEFARQLRIAKGCEWTCARCGCSETRACSGGCISATAALCSRCV
jgi:hypothetical protein